MRIGHIASGIRRSVHLDMSKALRRAGHEVCVFTEDPEAPSAYRFTRTTEDGVEIWAIHSERRNPMWWILDRGMKSLLGRRFFTTLDALNRYISESRCDVYMVEGDSLGFSLALLGYLRPLKWVLCMHDHELLGVKFGYIGERSDSRRENLKRWVLGKAPRIRANSHVTKEVLTRAGFDAANIDVVPLHWIPRMIVDGDLVAYRSNARREVLERHQQPADCELVLASCRLTPFKGLELAIEAMAHVVKVRPHARLMICGADRRVPGVGSYRAVLERVASEAGVSDRLVFTGDVHTDNMKQYYAAANVHVAPSHLDTFNYSALEAALVGTPSVLTDRVGSGPWLAECGAATILAGRDAGVFGEAIVRLLAAGDAGAAEMAGCARQALSPETLAPEVAAVLHRAAEAA